MCFSGREDIYNENSKISSYNIYPYCFENFSKIASLRSPVHFQKILKIQRQRNSPRYIPIPFSSTVFNPVHSSNYFHLSRSTMTKLEPPPLYFSSLSLSLSNSPLCPVIGDTSSGGRKEKGRNEKRTETRKKARNKGGGEGRRETVGVKDGDDDGAGRGWDGSGRGVF